jgi:hypothetical protein
MLEDKYSERLKVYEEKVTALKGQDLRFAAYRFVVGFSGIAFLVAALYFASLVPACFSVGLFIGFVVLVKKHQQIRSNLALNNTLVDINSEEINYLEGELSALPDGASYRDGKHYYADDLDVFGRGSLFQRINRSFNDQGQGYLAEWLRQMNFHDLADRQRTVDELKDRIDLRQRYFALARRLDEGGIASLRLEQWATQANTSPWWSKPLILWSLSLWFPLLAIVLSSTTGTHYLDQLIYPFLLNVLIFFQVFKQLRKDQASLDKLHQQFQVYAEMIKELESIEAPSPHLENTLKALRVEGRAASSILKDLAAILSRADSANNVFGAAVINGFVFYHLHVFRKLLNWKKAYASLLSSWVEVVHRMEAYMSLSTYAYNHPTFNLPVLTEQEVNVFEASALGHPFIREDQRVNNSISFTDMKLVVLTGSNMAGKSTFLRSIGMAMVMTSLGLPVCASSLRMSPFRLLSSMKPQDDVNENTSYFQAEVNRLRALMDVVESGENCFLLLDEILRGTNSEDKRNGTRGFLKRLQIYPIKGVLATHDVDIAEMAHANPAFKNYYFESGYDGKTLTFDYRLRQGVCASPNATQLLKLNNLID